VAHGGDDGPPYDSALGLGSWAWAHRSYIFGRVALSGGNPRALTLRDFLDAAEAIFVDEYRKMGLDLLSALEKMGGWSQAGPEASVASVDNASALSELENLMAGMG